jgi:hypothetical protein
MFNFSMSRNEFRRARTILYSGLAAMITTSAIAYPHLETNQRLLLPRHSYETLKKDLYFKNPNLGLSRQTLFMTYGEWKDYKEYRKSLENSKDPPKKPHPVEIKALLMIQNPNLAFSLLTPKELEDFKLELKLFDPFVDPSDISSNYGLQSISREGFQKNLGAMVLWYLNRQFNYNYSDELYKKTKK